MKDYQRSKVYSSENSYTHKWNISRWDNFSKKVYSSEMFKELSNEENIRVKVQLKQKRYDRKCKMGFYTSYCNLDPSGDHCVYLSHQHKNSKLIILHELSHVATYERTNGDWSHGPIFCAVFLELIGGFVGSKAKNNIKKTFEETGVEIGTL